MDNRKPTYQELQDELDALKKSYQQDILEKTKEIEALKSNVFKSEHALDTLPVGVVVYDKEGSVYHYNKYFQYLFGYTIEDVPNVGGWFLVAYPDKKYRDEVKKLWFSSIEEYEQTGKFTPVEARVKCKDGSYKDIEFGFEAIGETYLTTFVNLTKRKEIEKAHLQAVEFTEDLINSLPGIFYMFRLSSDDAKLIKWNINHEKQLGYTAEELLEKSVFDFFENEDRDFISNSIHHLFEKEELDNEAELVYADGSKHPYYFKAKSHTIEGNQFFFGIGINVSEQKNAEQALKESEEKYRKLYQSANDAIFLMDEDVIIDCNEETLEMFEAEKDKIIGTTPYKLSPLFQPDGVPSKEKAKKLIDIAINKEVKAFEWLHHTIKNNRLFYAEVSLSVLNLKGKRYLQAIVRDINERKIAELELEKYKNRLEELVKNRTDELEAANEELQSTNEELQFVNERITKQKEVLANTLDELKSTQAQLIESEKMASLGLLTSGVSHEINNPLNYIQAGIYSLENILNEENIDQNSFQLVLNHMQEGVNRVSKIVKSLNSYSKISGNKKDYCKIHKILNNCLLMLEHEFIGKCEIEKHYIEKEIGIIANEGELHHVFTNILQNAIQAIEHKGNITIKTNITGNGNLAQIKIMDTGKGISKENLPKIYDPFFTTKEPGKGTGLGLSIAFRIIKEHKGTIKYSSEIDKGTKVLITLPINQ